MKKMISITCVVLLVGLGVAEGEMTESSSVQTRSPMTREHEHNAGFVAPQSDERGKPVEADMSDMGMMGMGQAMMPSMINMMLAESRTPGSLPAGKMMNMPMMGASMMPMGLGGMGMMPLMMGGTSEDTAATLEKFRAFLKETKDSRKQLHDLSFVYFESRWTPETTIQQLQDTALKMRKLRDEIMAKMPR